MQRMNLNKNSETMNWKSIRRITRKFWRCMFFAVVAIHKTTINSLIASGIFHQVTFRCTLNRRN